MTETIEREVLHLTRLFNLLPLNPRRKKLKEAEF